MDKLTAYILATCLHASNFNVKLSEVAKSMNLPVTNLVKIARTMGGRMSREAGIESRMKLALGSVHIRLEFRNHQRSIFGAA